MNRKRDTEQKRLNQVRRAILINMIIVPFIPFILAIGGSFYHFTTALESGTIRSLERIVSDHGEMIDTFLNERTADLQLIASIFGFDDIIETGHINDMLSLLQKRSPAFVDLGVFDHRGVHLSYSGRFQLKGKRYRDEVWFNRVMEKGIYISDIFLGYRNVPHFVIAVRRESGGKRWILRATIDTLFFDRLVSNVQLGKTGESYILNHRGIVQSGKLSSNVPIMGEDPEFGTFPAALISGGAESDLSRRQTFKKSNDTGEEYIYAVTSVYNGKWLLVVRQEIKDAFTSFHAALYLSVSITLVGGAVIVGTAFFMTDRIQRWIQALSQEKESLGTQLIRASQLAEIGQMAAGFAHEINNPLQIIKGEHSLLEMLVDEMSGISGMEGDRSHGRFPEDEWRSFVGDTRESLDQIRLQIERCSVITGAVLKFGRQTETKHTSLHPGEVIPEMLGMIRNKATVNGIEISSHIPDDIPAFMGDPSQFQQVMLNLFNNAMDAVIGRHGVSGGVLSIHCSTSGDQQQQIDIAVSDNGMGIAPDLIDRIFSPFFTTKAVGKGSGLGLSVCYGIIESFGGTMAVSSQPDVGTTFTISLPVVM